MKIDEIKTLDISGIHERFAQIDVEKAEEGADIEALLEEARALNARKDELATAEAARKEIAERVANNEIGETIKEFKGDEKMNEREMRAKRLAEEHKTEFRALLSTGKIVKPNRASTEISNLPEVGIGIVDDVHAVPLVGNGSWVVAYKKTDAKAADITEGQKIGGTGATFDYVEISPKNWGVLDEVSNLIKKLSPVDYLDAIEESSVLALKVEASKKIFAAIEASDLKEEKTISLDQDYLRSLVLGFKAVERKGGVKLYIGQEDLATLGKIRGTSEKKALYEITFDQGTVLSGTIKEGGLAVPFRICDLEAGTQYFGQPGAIDMPMWDDYEIATDEGGEYFAKNLIGIRGTQLAGADLVAYHAIQKIANA